MNFNEITFCLGLCAFFLPLLSLCVKRVSQSKWGLLPCGISVLCCAVIPALQQQTRSYLYVHDFAAWEDTIGVNEQIDKALFLMVLVFCAGAVIRFIHLRRPAK